MKTKKNRWYDRHPELGELIEELKVLEKPHMNALLREIKRIINGYDCNLINNTVMQYPLGIDRRWYDRDPLSWMTINALKFADSVLRGKVVSYLKEQTAPEKEYSGARI